MMTLQSNVNPVLFVIEMDSSFSLSKIYEFKSILLNNSPNEETKIAMTIIVCIVCMDRLMLQLNSIPAEQSHQLHINCHENVHFWYAWIVYDICAVVLLFSTVLVFVKYMINYNSLKAQKILFIIVFVYSIIAIISLTLRIISGIYYTLICLNDTHLLFIFVGGMINYGCANIYI
eukprot:110994_1